MALINECFLILISLVDLITKSAISYTERVEIDYGIDSIIEQLADFLSFIRQLTHDYRSNGSKTQRNNSISLVFLLCRLLLFRKGDKSDSLNQSHDKSSPLFDEPISLNISQKIKEMSLNTSKPLHELRDFSSLASFASDTIQGNNDSQISSCRQSIDPYHTAIDHSRWDQPKQLWRIEFEIVLLDFALQHYYPEVFTLVKWTMEVS